MPERRVELRLTPDDPLWPLFSALPGRQRNALARAILEAALLPGGWAKLVQGQLAIALPSDSAASKPQPNPEPSASSPPLIEGMSAAGHQGFMEGLRQFVEME